METKTISERSFYIQTKMFVFYLSGFAASRLSDLRTGCCRTFYGEVAESGWMHRTANAAILRDPWVQIPPSPPIGIGLKPCLAATPPIKGKHAGRRLSDATKLSRVGRLELESWSTTIWYELYAIVSQRHTAGLCSYKTKEGQKWSELPSINAHIFMGL